MYVNGNPKSKKQVREWIAAGKTVTVFAPGLGEVPYNGSCSVEGPHHPAPHSWSGKVTIVDGKVVKIT